MKEIQLFSHQDLLRLGFIFLDPNQENLLLESINSEYIRRINRLLAEYLMPNEISTLVGLNETSIREYILAFKPNCIEHIGKIKSKLEDEIREERKNNLIKGTGTLFSRQTNDDVT